MLWRGWKFKIKRILTIEKFQQKNVRNENVKNQFFGRKFLRWIYVHKKRRKAKKAQKAQWIFLEACIIQFQQIVLFSKKICSDKVAADVDVGCFKLVLKLLQKFNVTILNFYKIIELLKLTFICSLYMQIWTNLDKTY